MESIKILPSAEYGLDGKGWSNLTTQTSSTLDSDINRYYLGRSNFGGTD
jgi:hypothetical protein